MITEKYTMHVDPPLRRSVVTEEHEASMVALRSAAEQIEGRIVIEEEVLGVACLRADNVWSLDRITAEEYREVETNNVVVAFFRVELDGESTRVASLVRELTTERDGREANKDGSLLANSLEEICFL